MKITGQKVVVVGAGRTGVAAAELLARNGATVVLSDSEVPDNVTSIQRRLSDLNVEFELGRHEVERFVEADLVVLSPGVPPGIEPVRAAERVGVPVLGEMEFAYRFSGSRLIAVTGTNGKTTATTLVYRMIKEAGRTVLLAGNNESPLSEAVAVRPRPEFVVLEVSSFALERVETFRPEVAVFLNVTPDHLERYDGMDDYRRTKMRIFAQQTVSDTAVINGDDPQMCADAGAVDAKKLFFSLEREVDNGVFVSEGDVVAKLGSERKCLLPVEEVALAGRHNQANVLAALCVCLALDLPEEAYRKALRVFSGLEHRMEFVAKRDGVTFVNDSKATNIDALEKALMSIEAPVILIAGGRGKGSDYASLRDLVKVRVKALVLVGEDAPLIETAFGDLVPVSRADSIEDAVRKACANASDGDCVLLSPACASFDMFRNFEERGETFKAAVLSL
jgi:UDP-N-acetylmuramoylalanine--D-glutamate ligase